MTVELTNTEFQEIAKDVYCYAANLVKEKNPDNFFTIMLVALELALANHLNNYMKHTDTPMIQVLAPCMDRLEIILNAHSKT